MRTTLCVKCRPRAQPRRATPHLCCEIVVAGDGYHGGTTRGLLQDASTLSSGPGPRRVFARTLRLSRVRSRHPVRPIFSRLSTSKAQHDCPSVMGVEFFYPAVVRAVDDPSRLHGVLVSCACDQCVSAVPSQELRARRRTVLLPSGSSVGLLCYPPCLPASHPVPPMTAWGSAPSTCPERCPTG